ncbi:uncharacterized protein LOC135210651 [Macrobrachium nipponense]|uniref:uncharacterized protein LOC135210651 n=1 Tax=Macrobrachium nipponense TaxID=159736 RepID=UPI0030C88D3B
MDKRIGFNQGDALCSLSLSSLTKDENAAVPWHCSFIIKNLMDILGMEEEERLLCPNIPPIEADDVGEDNFESFEVAETSAVAGAAAEETDDEDDSITEPVNRKEQDELISRLMTDGMSFTEVAALLGEDADVDSDVEDSLSVTQEPECPGEDHAAEFEKELNEQQR